MVLHNCVWRPYRSILGHNWKHMATIQTMAIWSMGYCEAELVVTPTVASDCTSMGHIKN